MILFFISSQELAEYEKVTDHVKVTQKGNYMIKLILDHMLK